MRYHYRLVSLWVHFLFIFRSCIVLQRAKYRARPSHILQLAGLLTWRLRGVRQPDSHGMYKPGLEHGWPELSRDHVYDVGADTVGRL